MKNLKNWLIATIVALILLMSWLSVHYNNIISDRNDKITLLKGNNDSLYTLVNKNKELITTKEAEIVHSKELLKEYTDSIFNLQKKYEKQISGVIAFYKSKIGIRIDSFETAWVDTVKMKRYSDSVEAACSDVLSDIRANTVQVGTTASADTAGLHFNAKILKTGLQITDLQMVDTISVRIVEIKGGFFKHPNTGSKKRVFFKHKSFEVQTKHSSPLFKNEWQESIVYQPKNKHPLLKGAVLGAAGYFIITEILPLIK